MPWWDGAIEGKDLEDLFALVGRNNGSGLVDPEAGTLKPEPGALSGGRLRSTKYRVCARSSL